MFFDVSWLRSSFFQGVGVPKFGLFEEFLCFVAPRFQRFFDIYWFRSSTFAKTSDGQVWAFGLNNFGQLGFGDTKDRVLPASVPALRGAGVEAIDGGEHHSIALTAEGGVMAWGRADSGQLGLDRGDDGAR